MKEELYGWMKNLAVFYILFTAFLHLVPDRKYERYVRLFMGLLLIGMISTPVFALLGRGEQLIENFQFHYEEEKELMEQEEARQLQILYLTGGYEEQIREKIMEAVENTGIKLADVTVHIEGERVSAVLFVWQKPDAEQERRVKDALWEKCGIGEEEAVICIKDHGEDTMDRSSASGDASGSSGNAGIS